MVRLYRSPHFRGLVPPVLLLILWWLATTYQWVNSSVLVPFEQLYHSALNPELQQSLLTGLEASFTRLLEGSAIGIGAGLVLGIALGLSSLVDRMIGPSFHAARQVAIFAWIPLLTAWFGNGDICKVVFVALAAFYPVVMGTYEGIRSVPHSYLEVGRALCFSRVQMLRRIILPSAAPSIVTSLQLAFIFSWFAAVGAEYVIGKMSTGIGSVVMAAQENLQPDVVLLGVILISLVGILMNKILRQIPRYLFRWRDAA